MPRSGANDLAQLLGDNVGKAGGSDRRSEGTEQDVGKSSSRVAGEAGREQLHNAVALSSVDGDIKGRHLKEPFTMRGLYALYGVFSHFHGKSSIRRCV